MPVGQAIGKQVATVSRISLVGTLRFIIKHWYLVTIFIFILPTIITSVKTGMAENSDYPILEQLGRAGLYSGTQLGLTLINADSQIDKDVKILREDSTLLFGEKPDGLISKAKYYWNYWLVIWKIIGNIFLISVPFMLAFRYFKFRGKEGVESSHGKNIISAIIVGITFIFLMNLIFTIIGLIDGSLTMSFPEGIDIYKKVWLVLLNVIPFHGVINLIGYLVGI